MRFFGELGCVASSDSWLDIGADVEHDPDPGIVKRKFYRCRK